MGILWDDIEKRGRGYQSILTVLPFVSSDHSDLWIGDMAYYCAHDIRPRGNTFEVFQRNIKYKTTGRQGGVLVTTELNGNYKCGRNENE